MLEDLGNIGDFLGGIGVVITLAYLAVQIRQNSRSVKASAAQSVLQSLSEALSASAASPGLTRVVAVGLTDFEQLDESEQTQLFVWLFAWFRIIEQAHQHYTMGNIEEDQWRSQIAHLKTLMVAPACSRFWEVRRMVFSASFRSFVDSLDSEGAAPSTSDALATFRGDSDSTAV